MNQEDLELRERKEFLFDFTHRLNWDATINVKIASVDAWYEIITAEQVIKTFSQSVDIVWESI
jgi:hypothetical protein